MTTKEPRVVTVAGVRVQVLLGEDGRPSSAGARIDRPGNLDSERIAALAANRAFEGVLAEAQQVQRKGSSADAARQSAEKRAEASVADYAIASPWLEQAHAAHPEYGKDKLAQYARRLAAHDKKPLDPEQRAKITPARARQFLKQRHNIGG